MKTLEQIQGRILGLRSRAKDGLNVQDEIDILEEIENFYEIPEAEREDLLIEIAVDYLGNHDFKKSRITIWALE